MLETGAIRCEVAGLPYCDRTPVVHVTYTVLEDSGDEMVDGTFTGNVCAGCLEKIRQVSTEATNGEPTYETDGSGVFEFEVGPDDDPSEPIADNTILIGFTDGNRDEHRVAFHNSETFQAFVRELQGRYEQALVERQAQVSVH